MRIGVNTGTIVVGGSVAGHAISLGDPMNVAARLEAHAPPGEILIGAETRSWSAVRCAPSLPASSSCAAAVEPTAAHRLLAVEGRPSAIALAERPLVGRGRELGLLTVAFERAAARGSREFVSVLGDAGVGKSRLVAELVERYRERATVLIGRCLSYGEGITYWALAEMIRRAAEIGEDDPPEERRAKLARAVAGAADGELVARHLLQLLGLEAGGEPSEQSAWAVRRLLEIVAERRPVIVIFDDLHWAEPVLLDLLVEVATTVDGPVLCVCMARFELLERRADWERECRDDDLLRPLSEADTRAVVEALVGAALPGAFRDRLVELAAGNPLFVEQVLHMLIDDGRLEHAEEGWRTTGDAVAIEVPPTIEAILAARIDNLGGAERALRRGGRGDRDGVLGRAARRARRRGSAAGARAPAAEAGGRAHAAARRPRRHAPLPSPAAPRRRLRGDPQGAPGACCTSGSLTGSAGGRPSGWARSRRCSATTTKPPRATARSCSAGGRPRPAARAGDRAPDLGRPPGGRPPGR